VAASEPSSLLLMGSGLLGLAGWRRTLCRPDSHNNRRSS
jgi:hypothetical protein